MMDNCFRDQLLFDSDERKDASATISRRSQDQAPKTKQRPVNFDPKVAHCSQKNNNDAKRLTMKCKFGGDLFSSLIFVLHVDALFIETELHFVSRWSKRSLIKFSFVQNKMHHQSCGVSGSMR
jgi:hypothetical protein